MAYNGDIANFRLKAAPGVGATTVTLNDVPEWARGNGGWVVIDAGTIEAEERKVTAANISGAVCTITALAYAHAVDDKCIWLEAPDYNVTFWGAKGDNSTDATTSINRASAQASLAGGGIVNYPTGIYVISTPLIIQSKVHWLGDGMASTKIFLKAASNCDMVQTKDLVADFAAETKDSEFDFSIIGMTFDGNEPNQTTGGRGLALYGCGYRLRDLHITQCWSHGLWTCYNPDASVALPTGATLEARYNNITISWCHGNGWLFKGPTDSMCDDVVIYQCGKENGAIVQDGNDCGGEAGCGLVLDESTATFGYGGSLMIGKLHIYAVFGDGMWVKAGGYTKAEKLELDANYRMGIHVQRDRCEFDSIYAYKNNRELDGWYHVKLASNENYIGTLFIDHRWADTALKLDVSGGGGLWMYGNKNTVGSIHAWGAGTTNLAVGATWIALAAGSKTAVGVLIDGNYNTIVGGKVYEWNQGSSVGLDSGNGGVNIFNQITLTISDCQTCWYNNTGAAGSKLGQYKLLLNANEGVTGQVLFAGDGPQVAADSLGTTHQDRWDILARDGTSGAVVIYRSQNMLIGTVDLNSAASQTITLNHWLLVTPNARNITISPIYQIGGVLIPVVDYYRITNIGAVTLDIIIKLNGALGVANGYINVWCGVTP